MCPLPGKHQRFIRARILVQVMIHRRLLIGQDGRLDQSEAYDVSQLVREYGPCVGLTLSVQGSTSDV